MESIPPPLNGHAELTPADDEPEDNADALNRVSDGWQLSPWAARTSPAWAPPCPR